VRPRGGSTGEPARVLATAGLVLAACVFALAGCAAMEQVRGAASSSPRSASTEEGPSPIDFVRAHLDTGNLDAADAAIAAALAAAPAGKKGSPPGAITQTPDTAEFLVLRAELRIRQGRPGEAEADAMAAMALVPPTSAPDVGAPTESSEAAEPATSAGNTAAPPRRPALTQRSIHIRLAQLFEDAGNDDSAEQHLAAARELCIADPALLEQRECEREREALVRIRVARGRYAEAEPLVLAEIMEVQSLFGADDLRLSFAMCEAARFYARQGKYALSGPLFSRSFDLWKSAHEDALAEYTRALAAKEPVAFDAEFLRPRAGHAPFAAPCGLDEQPGLLYKLGKPTVALEAIRYEQQLWANNTEAGAAALAYLDVLALRGGDPLDVASARHAVAFIAQRKGDAVRAEQELRSVTEAYAAAWPSLPVSERRFRAEDYLKAMESLTEFLRSSKRFPEAIALGDRAVEIASANVDAYDSLRLDTLLSSARTFREMRDARRAETAAGRYLDAIVAARGDTSSDYAWALRTISYAYLLRDELDASQRMEMQAKAIWAKQSTVAPQF